MFLDVIMFALTTVAPFLGQTPGMVLLGLVALAGIEVVISIMVWAIWPDLQRLDRWLMAVLEEGVPPEEEPWREGRMTAILPPEVAKRSFRAARGGR